ncbi:MAG: UDP-3-O-acyl-N-acetylglucosamine deacetylase [Parvularculaceae bacterium]
MNDLVTIGLNDNSPKGAAVKERGVSSQTTLRDPIELPGVGLHTGVPCRVRLTPAPADFGLAFQRMDLPLKPLIAARADAVRETRLGTQIEGEAGASVRTVEHLLAALSLKAIDNARIEIDADEPPVADGSAREFVDAIDAAGVVPLDAPRTTLRIVRALEVRDGARFVRVEPGEGRRWRVDIDFEDAAIGAQSVAIDLDDPRDVDRIASARTFCRRSEIEAMRAAGFARGGSLDNAIVVDGATILNEGGLRDPLEFALHKALDLVGDLALLGTPVFGVVTASRPGHDLNAALARAIARGLV